MTSYYKNLILFGLVVFLMGSCSIKTDSDFIVQLHSGPVSGRSESGVMEYLGIPYAAPPVGELRWKAPEDVAHWKQVRECTKFGPSCPQPNQKDNYKYSEDCLYLNVWTPAESADEKLPVMVWIHGGAFNFGSSSLPEYHGRNLALKGVVVVTVNYRLGPLGFLVHPLLSEESPNGVSGNYGLMDQIHALKWVRKNIAQFGGDPHNITIFGQSAGSRSVALQMISPLSEGLFHRAIAQSGGPIIGSEYLSPVFNGDMAAVKEMGVKLSGKLNCDKEKDILGAMRKKSADEIVAAADCRTGLFEEGLFFAPVFDGYVLPLNPQTAYTGGMQHDVPIITGSVLNEGNLYLANETDITTNKYQYFMESRFNSNLEEAIKMFPAKTDQEVPGAVDEVITAGANAYPARLIARCMEKKKSGAYLYQFTRRPDTKMARKLGVFHGVDLAYVFGNMGRSDGYNETDFALCETIMAYWVNFAKTGDPNGGNLPKWPLYSRETDLNMEFGDTVTINKNLYRAKCDFFKKIKRR